MSTAFLVFRTYGPDKCIFLAACKSRESAEKFINENGILLPGGKIYSTRTAAQLYAERKLVIEEVHLI